MTGRDPYEEEISKPPPSPLIPIGLAIFAVLLVPIFLYSVGPEGPIKVGDVVFSTDRHRVVFARNSGMPREKPEGSCVLESRVQLVIQKIEGLPMKTFIAQPIGVEPIVRPFCPPRKSVVVYSHQVSLKADLWGSLKNTLGTLFTP